MSTRLDSWSEGGLSLGAALCVNGLDKRYSG